MLFFRTHLWEEQYVLDGGGTGHEHGKTVDTHTKSRCRWHTVLKSANEVHIDVHSLVITFRCKFELLLEPVKLVDRVVKLTLCIGKLLTVYE